MIRVRQSFTALLLTGIFAAFGGSVGRAVERLTLTFDSSAPGEPPAELEFAAARQPTPGIWQVRGAGAQKHLVHAGDPYVTMRGISVGAVSAPAPADVRVTARLRLIDADMAGGLVWRYRDANNFYFLGVVLSDHTIVLFRVTGGNRVLLNIIRDVNLDPAGWHTLTVVHQGDRIRGIVNGLSVVGARDSAIAGGRAGLWSAGNSTTWFDDLVIEDAQ